jgi:hypothetical protein
MAQGGMRDGIHVEWINITYRSVATIVLVVALLAGGAGVWWYHKNRLGPRNDAQGAISRAASKLSEAVVLPLDPEMRQLVEKADDHLKLARAEFEESDFPSSVIAARQSQELSSKALAGASGGNAESRLVKINKLEGDVRVKQAGSFSWTGATMSTVLRAGDQVKTSSNSSAEVIYFDGTVTRIQPGSLLEIRDLYEDPVTKVRRVKQKLSWGEISASTQQRNVNGSYHEVAAGKIAARTEDAGRFRVAVDEAQQTSLVDVFDGKVELATPDTKEVLQSGERIRAAADGRLSAKETLPGVPRLISPSDQRVFIFEDPAQESITLNWETLTGIRRFRLVISDQPLFTSPLYNAERDDLSAVLEGVGTGTYYWKVAAVNGAGVTGPFSDSRSFRISSERIRDRTDTEPPSLKITEFVTLGQMVIINGTTEPGATLWVDNNKVDISEEGSFNTVVRLRREGLNEIRLMAQDTAGNQSTLSRNAYVEVF